MRYEEWEPIYLQIVRDFGYEVSRDLESAELLSSLLGKSRISPDTGFSLLESMRGMEAMIVGPCEMPDSGWDSLVRMRPGRIVASVGEGTESAMRAGVAPDLIFTDLDGFPQIDLDANARGSTLVVHAHGDNMDALEQWVPLLKGKAIGTSQCRPPAGVFNWGGFTDGDRAYCALRHFKARSIEMYGFDFREPCGKKRADPAVKKRKLQWAEKIIAIAAKND